MQGLKQTQEIPIVVEKPKEEKFRGITNIGSDNTGSKTTVKITPNTENPKYSSVQGPNDKPIKGKNDDFTPKPIKKPEIKYDPNKEEKEKTRMALFGNKSTTSGQGQPSTLSNPPLKNKKEQIATGGTSLGNVKSINTTTSSNTNNNFLDLLGGEEKSETKQQPKSKTDILDIFAEPAVKSNYNTNLS